MADIKLTPQQVGQFKEALLSAFPTPDSMAQVVKTELGLNFYAIVSPGRYDDQVFQLVTWAEAQGRLLGLIGAACAANSGNPTLQKFARTVQQYLPDGDSTSPLSSSVYQRCLTALSQCGEFADDATLREVMNEQGLAVLLTQQTSLAASPAQRTAKVLDDLLPGYLADGRLALVGLLHVLSQRNDTKEPLSQELIRLEAEVTDALGSLNPLIVSFVVAAMTDSEANTLLRNTSLPLGLRSFLDALEQEDRDDLATCYLAERDAWSPPGHPAVTIRDVVVNMVNRFNRKQIDEAQEVLIRPIFESARFFDPDDYVWDATKTYLERSENVVVIIADAVSLFHEYLHTRLQDSGMLALGQRPMLIFSPVSDRYVQTRQLIQAEIAKKCKSAFIRFDTHLDRSCEIGIDDVRSLRRWLFGVLPDAVQRVQPGGLRPENREVFFKEPVERRGYRELMWGSRQSRAAGRWAAQ